MRASWALSLALIAAACSEGGITVTRPYQNNDLMLVAHHAARDACSCMFVMEMSDEFCQAWVKAAPDVAKWTADKSNKTVEVSTLLLWGAKAHFVDSHVGCVLE